MQTDAGSVSVKGCPRFISFEEVIAQSVSVKGYPRVHILLIKSLAGTKLVLHKNSISGSAAETISRQIPTLHPKNHLLPCIGALQSFKNPDPRQTCQANSLKPDTMPQPRAVSPA